MPQVRVKARSTTTELQMGQETVVEYTDRVRRMVDNGYLEVLVHYPDPDPEPPLGRALDEVPIADHAEDDADTGPPVRPKPAPPKRAARSALDREAAALNCDPADPDGE